MIPRWLALVSCSLATPWACSPGLPRPGASHIEALRASDPSVRLVDLQRGRELYAARCAGCHVLKDPHVIEPGAWASEIEKMRREQEVVLEFDEARDIERYLRAASLIARR